MRFYDNDFLVKPFNDDKMSYDIEKHQYILDLDYSLQETGVSLVELWGNNDNANGILMIISNVSYTILSKYKDNTKYYDRTLYWLSHSKKGRDFIKNLMLDMVRYNHEDGGMFIAYQTGINLQEMKDVQVQLHHAYSAIAEQIMEKYGQQARVELMNINTMSRFSNLNDLLTYMLSESLITQEQLDLVEEIKDIPYNYKYKVFINAQEQFVCEDTLTFKKAMEKFGVDW